MTSLPGLRGVAARIWDQAKPWLVVVLTGIATGTIASCLDVLSSWLSDLRLGVCRDMWWMSRNLCCAGLDREFSNIFVSLFARKLIQSEYSIAAETCRAWRTWGEIVGDEQHIVLRAITQYSLYMILAVSFRFSISALRVTLTYLFLRRSSLPYHLQSSYKSSLRTLFTPGFQRSKRF